MADTGQTGTQAAVDTLYRVDEKLGNVIEPRATVIVAGVLLRVNAIHGAGIDAGGVLGPNARLGNNVCHGATLPGSTLCLPT